MSIYITALLWILFCITGTVNAAEKQPVPERAYAAYDLDAVRNVAKFMAKQAVVLNLGEPLSPMTFTNFGGGTVYYALYDTLLIRRFDLAKRGDVAGWRLNHYPDLQVEKKANNQGVAFSYEYVELPGIGCLLKYPLRYGDVNNDGKKELVILFSGNTQDQENMAVFSPEVGKVIFASILTVNRAIDSSPEVLEQLYPDWGGTSEYQYSYDEGRSPPSLSMGYRTFGKHFFGDINDDGTQDIILWRKYFESLKQGDTKKGFAKKDELFVHYSLVDGDYKKQPTAAKTIKGWLAAKQLSWQQGFPSRSECPGQEGQLIPELHDPLLNDPDVLH